MKHLTDYLEYYCRLEKPGFAVLVTGKWGVGKTYQVKSFFTGREHCYVSLFGIKTDADLYASVAKVMEPFKAGTRRIANQNKAASIGMMGVSLPVGAIASTLADLAIIEKVNSDKTLIFDDFERCEIETKQVLGIIDRYLQQYGCRVVVVANDEKVDGKIDDYKEKLFGQTLRITPNADEAFDQFAARFKGRERDFFDRQKNECLRIFQESGVESLRVLGQMMSDWARLHSCLTETHLASREFTLRFSMLFLALSSQVRSLAFRRGDIYNRKTHVLAAEMAREGNKTDRIFEASQRFKSIDITYGPISDDLLEQMLFDGIYDKAAIQKALSESPAFSTPEHVPPWRTLLEWDNLDVVQIESAIHALRNDFLSRSIVDLGAILHMFAFELMFASNGGLARDTCLGFTQASTWDKSQ